MNLIQTNIFESLFISSEHHVSCIDVFDVPGKKTITLAPHSSLIYLVVGVSSSIDLRIITTWPHCSCVVFGLFASDTERSISGSLNVSLDHDHTSAQVELVSFLYDGAKVAIDGEIGIDHQLNHVSGHLLQQNIVLGKNVSIATVPKLNIASHNVRASHGANIDSLDGQKLFYMMSRGLTKKQSQKLLVDWYIDTVLSHFSSLETTDKQYIYDTLM